MQVFAKFPKNSVKGVQSHLKFSKIYCVAKAIPACSPVVGQFFDAMIVASIDKEWQL